MSALLKWTNIWNMAAVLEDISCTSNVFFFFLWLTTAILSGLIHIRRNCVLTFITLLSSPIPFRVSPGVTIKDLWSTPHRNAQLQPCRGAAAEVLNEITWNRRSLSSHPKLSARGWRFDQGLIKLSQGRWKGRQKREQFSRCFNRLHNPLNTSYNHQIWLHR